MKLLFKYLCNYIFGVWFWKLIKFPVELMGGPQMIFKSKTSIDEWSSYRCFRANNLQLMEI